MICRRFSACSASEIIPFAFSPSISRKRPSVSVTAWPCGDAPDRFETTTITTARTAPSSRKNRIRSSGPPSGPMKANGADGEGGIGKSGSVSGDPSWVPGAAHGKQDGGDASPQALSPAHLHPAALQRAFFQIAGDRNFSVGGFSEIAGNGFQFPSSSSHGMAYHPADRSKP